MCKYNNIIDIMYIYIYIYWNRSKDKCSMAFVYIEYLYVCKKYTMNVYDYFFIILI